MKPEYIKYYNQENWPLAKQGLQNHLSENPNDHYELALLASIYRIEEDYDKAFDFIAKALESNKYCPIVLWHLADISDMMDKDDWARTTWRYLIQR